MTLPSIEGYRKLIVASGLGGLIYSIPETSQWVTIAKIGGLAALGGVHIFAQSRVDKENLKLKDAAGFKPGKGK